MLVYLYPILILNPSTWEAYLTQKKQHFAAYILHTYIHTLHSNFQLRFLCGHEFMLLLCQVVHVHGIADTWAATYFAKTCYIRCTVNQVI